MIVGVKRVICTCETEMIRTGGVFGVETTSSTYYCEGCRKYVLVLTPNEKKQKDFRRKYDNR